MQRWWKNSSILPWPPHVVFEKGVAETEMASLPCRSVERLPSGDTRGIAVSSVGFVPCRPFLPEKVLLPQQRQGSRGQAREEEQQQHGVRRPVPWPCSH